MGHPFLPDVLRAVVGWLSFLVGAVGVGVLLGGAYSTVVRLIGGQVAAAREAPAGPPQDAPGQPFRSSLLLSLDFLIGAAVIETLVAADWKAIATLGGLVAARAAAGFVVRWEADAGFTRGEKESAARAPAAALEARNGVYPPSECPVNSPAEAGQ
jgi:uncharacterized membrane protein